MLIEVTQYDIDFGVPHECRACPIARAMRRQTGIAWDVGEDDAHNAVASNGSRPINWIRLGEEATKFMLDFDVGHAVYPFSFEFGTTIFDADTPAIVTGKEGRG